MTIYFNRNKEAYANEIPDPIATTDIETWSKYCSTEVGVGWDIIGGEFTPLKDAKDIDEEQESAERERERLSLYLEADNQISKCDNYILLDMDVEEYTRLKIDWLQYKMEVRKTKEQESYPFEVVYPDRPEDV